jgi:hypothetical protein
MQNSDGVNRAEISLIEKLVEGHRIDILPRLISTQMRCIFGPNNLQDRRMLRKC